MTKTHDAFIELVDAYRQLPETFNEGFDWLSPQAKLQGYRHLAHLLIKSMPPLRAAVENSGTVTSWARGVPTVRVIAAAIPRMRKKRRTMNIPNKSSYPV